MGSRTKNAAKRAWEKKNGLGKSNGRFAGVNLASSIFDAKAHDQLEADSKERAKATLEERATQRRAARRGARALPAADSVRVAPTRKSAYTPPKVRERTTP